ncbi:amino acid ABC transporter permease [Glaesserella parasuis]|uniref:amino acid ABC transporter permease n=1 Tax=Glaesserella parasuis TaxID=738 RepID=UPI00135DDC65|nr:amino acid ABC transporter permease [Glaesserella parasuis]MCT8831892.1 amino acid ABC transporter permease [Glaesserella parasuis]MCT8838510.1 amino acid ABC transporter permease [Glaesserella parasuis]MCT8840325.1 amino acid ABC transporter permease [Glaesserella parasuis]MDE3933283.1 amino acid ABC transporter permease [Glaesserella parasuis]MDO9655767.1 amino acid ABC transporter permease [Glaesserella parasuis]
MAFDWLFEGENARRLAQGLWITAQISFISVGISLITGTLFGLFMRSRHILVQSISRLYLETVRIVPILVWLFMLYFGLSTWFNIHSSGLWVCIWVFVIWGTAEMGDLVRGALTSIDKHQIESAKAIGLKPWQIFWFIELPQGTKRVLPSTINLFTRMIKTSSLAALIGVIEMVKVGQQIIENSLFTNPHASFFVYGLIFVLYFVICYPLSLWASWLEKRWV